MATVAAGFVADSEDFFAALAAAFLAAAEGAAPEPTVAALFTVSEVGALFVPAYTWKLHSRLFSILGYSADPFQELCPVTCHPKVTARIPLLCIQPMQES